MDSDQAQKLLEQIRQSYLLELPSKCDEIESLILTLKANFAQAFDELFRCVHSIKGSAGIHGLIMVSTICHELEDCLTLAGSVRKEIPEAKISIMLQLIDLVRRAVDIGQDARPDFREIESGLDDLRKLSLKSLQPVLLVESGYGALLVQEALRELPVQVTVETDGLKALQRLLTTRFACVITANEVKSLNGFALLAALRASGVHNKNIKSILLTSSAKLAKQKDTEFDSVVVRSASFGEDLIKTVSVAITSAATVEKMHS